MKASVAVQLQRLQELEKTSNDQTIEIDGLRRSFESSKEDIVKLIEITAHQAEEIKHLNEFAEKVKKILSEIVDSSPEAGEAFVKHVYDLEG